jgi:hypothetical protein
LGGREPKVYKIESIPTDSVWWNKPYEELIK